MRLSDIALEKKAPKVNLFMRPATYQKIRTIADKRDVSLNV